MYIAESIIFFLPIPLNISYEIHYWAINSRDFLGDHKFFTFISLIGLLCENVSIIFIFGLPSAFPIAFSTIPLTQLSC